MMKDLYLCSWLSKTVANFNHRNASNYRVYQANSIRYEIGEGIENKQVLKSGYHKSFFDFEIVDFSIFHRRKV